MSTHDHPVSPRTKADHYEKCTHTPAFRDLMLKGWDDFTALSHSRGVDVDTEVSTCNGCSIQNCTAKTASDALNDERKGVVFNLMFSFCDHVVANRSGTYNMDDKMIGLMGSAHFSRVSKFYNNPEQFRHEV